MPLIAVPAFRKTPLGLLLCISLVWLSGCTATRFLEEGERFYEGAKFDFTKNGQVGKVKKVESRLEPLVSPKPNFKLLGSRPGVWLYFVTETTKEKGLKSWLHRKLGEEPVLMEDVKPQQVSDILQGNLFNNGFFETEVRPDIVSRPNRATVHYQVDLYPPFRINSIEYPNDSIFRQAEIEDDSTFNDAPIDIAEASVIKKDDRFQLAMLSNEKSRIEALLENQGYYYFDDQYLIFEADTTVGGRRVDLTLTYAAGVPDKAKRRYVFRDVTIVNDYSLWQDSSANREPMPRDTTRVNNFTYIDSRDNFRPDLLTSYVNITSGETYTRDAHDYTLSHLMNLGTFKFVNIKYDNPDSTALDVKLFLTPRLKKSLRFEVEGVTKSNNFIGPRVGVTFTNRNIFGGGEEFEVKVNGSYEVQVNRQQPGALTATELMAEASLSVPRMISPIRISHYSSKYVPRTIMRLGYSLQERIKYFRINSLNTAFGYQWRETTNRSHELYPVDVNYVNVSDKSPEFEELLASNPVLAAAFQNQFIPAMRYSFTLNTQLKDPSALPFLEKDETSTDFFFNTNFSLAGNLINLIQNGVGERGEDGTYTLFGQPYAQFVLGDVDFRYYFPLSSGTKLVTRLALGAGYAYGNADFLPYIKQFSVGGPNSVRAFLARSIGPGTYDYQTDPAYANTGFIDQRGDVKLEANAEYRFDIVKFLKGGLFLDAGNIWFWNDEDTREGGKFDPDTFIQELAVGTGFGLRLDFSFFILRFDLGMPLRKPTRPAGDRWVLDEIDLSSSEWRKQNLILNIAIGYPF